MTKRTRYFIVFSTLTMVAVLGTGLVAYYNGGLPLMASHEGPQDMTYVPADATMVAYANVRDIMSSEFRQKLKTAVPTGEGRNEFLNETGIDLERDVNSVLVAASALPDADADTNPLAGHGGPDRGILLVRGAFNQAQIEASAVQRGATQDQYKGIRLVKANDGTTVAFLENGLVGIGRDAYVRQAIDASKGDNVTRNSDIMRLVADVDGNSNAWAVGRLDDVQKVAALPEPIKAQASAVQWFSIAGHVDGGVSGVIRAEARDDKAAENLRDVVRGAMALARFQMGHDQNLDTVINSLQMTGTGKTVQLSFAVPSDIVDSFAGLSNLVNHHTPDDLRQLRK